MSLFGDPSPTESTPAPATSKSLFGNEPAAASSTSLFDDDANGSPWSMPTPKKQARQNLLKSLLPATDVPESYIDAFDTVVEDEGQSAVSYEIVESILRSASLSVSDRTRILGFVAPSGQDGFNSLGRSEFNVLLALVGLAQEGEELSLDSVDDRRRRMMLRCRRVTDADRSQASHSRKFHTLTSCVPKPNSSNSSALLLLRQRHRSKFRQSNRNPGKTPLETTRQSTLGEVPQTRERRPPPLRPQPCRSRTDSMMPVPTPGAMVSSVPLAPSLHNQCKPAALELRQLPIAIPARWAVPDGVATMAPRVASRSNLPWVVVLPIPEKMVLTNPVIEPSQQ